MAVDLVIHSVRLAEAEGVTDAAWLAVDDGRVVDRGTGDGWRGLAPRDTVDGAGDTLTPGFVDLHCHGGAGHAFDDGAEAIAAARAMHRARGTTRSVISLVTAPLDDLAARAAMVAELTRSDPELLGVHLEGPFLDPGHRGAHDPALLRPPTAENVHLLLAAADGQLRQITLAPELPAAATAIARIVDAGAAVAVGHTDATFDQAQAAFDAGASILTHAFNAMNPIHHRAPGPVVAATANPEVTIEIIADGVHVHPTLVELVAGAARGRVALITDAMAAAGHGDGHYLLGSLDVEVEEGVARLAGGTSLAGSTLTQDAALRIAVDAGLTLPDAVAALTVVPARAIGVDYGTLAVGAVADAVLLDADLTVRDVWVAGSRVAR